jgi:S-adenosylmethionine:tRNA ribosyltransferase-isomerase
LEKFGEVPLPPYIHRAVTAEDEKRYQSVFAQNPGSVAAPTASLHFDEAMLATLRNSGIHLIHVTLHVGSGTFKPVEAEHIVDHPMHSEYYRLTEEAAAKVASVKKAGGRVFAVGTTAARVLESCSRMGPEGFSIAAGAGETRLFISPGYRWKCVDGLLTNFHWPKSTLFMLVSSLLGLEAAKAIYAEAMQRGFRLFSYGDAMLIL